MSSSRKGKILRGLKVAQDDMVPRSGTRLGLYLGLALLVVLTLASALLLSGSADEKRLSIYANIANYSVVVTEHNNVEYVGLLEVLEPLGRVSAKINKDRLRLRYNNVESEFTAGKTQVRIRGNDFNLPANFVLENQRGLVPVSCLGALLPQILGGPITFHESARRLFIGNVAVHFTAQVNKATPPQLVMQFSSPVNPMIATEPGKLRMVFTHEPLVAPGVQVLTFDSNTIPSATFRENNGAAEVLVTGTVPLMASFSNDGRTITIAAPSAVNAQAPPQPAPTIPASAPLPPTYVAPSSTVHYFALVDASHGGEERGAALSDQLAEKDVTLAVARRLRQELDSQGLLTLLLRDNDITLTADQRATMTNAAAPAIYICVHAVSQGNGVRLYTALMPTAGENHGPFLNWDSAQASFQEISQVAETSVATELRNKQIPVRTLVAPLRPLNNILTAALAVEVAPPRNDVSQLNSSAYQQLIASAVAAGVADVRDKLVGRK